MFGGKSAIKVFSGTSLGTAAAMSFTLGDIPDVAIWFDDVTATNPNMYIWFNKNSGHIISGPANTDDAIKVTGSTGVYTVATTVADQYAGGDTATSTTVTNKTYVNDIGTAIASGVITSSGLTIKAGGQANSGKLVGIAIYGAR